MPAHASGRAAGAKVGKDLMDVANVLGEHLLVGRVGSVHGCKRPEVRR